MCDAMSLSSFIDIEHNFMIPHGLFLPLAVAFCTTNSVGFHSVYFQTRAQESQTRKIRGNGVYHNPVTQYSRHGIFQTIKRLLVKAPCAKSGSYCT